MGSVGASRNTETVRMQAELDNRIVTVDISMVSIPDLRSAWEEEPAGTNNKKALEAEFRKRGYEFRDGKWRPRRR